jgi:hypothetical protein
MKKLFFTILLVFTALSVKAQKNVYLTISPKMSGSDLLMGTNLINFDGVTFNLNHFDYYLSGLFLIHDGGQIIDLTDTIYIVKPDSFVLELGNFDITSIEQITFSIGVPPNLNTINGANAIDISEYPESHPLSFQDPSMNWGWSTGYMHMIIGGAVDTDADGITNAVFELHNLGDINYFNVTLPVIQTNTINDQIDVYLNCNLDQWMKNIDIATVGILHGSNGVNRDILKNINLEPVFTQSATASIPALQEEIGKSYFSSTSLAITVTWENVLGATNYVLSDISGKKIQFGSIDHISGNLVFENLINGLYNFQLLDKNNKLLNAVKIAK